jgi:cell shape-determining protein MreC
MTMYDRSPRGSRSSSPALQATMLLAVALLLAAMPAGWTAALKLPVQAALRPGLTIAMYGGQAIDTGCSRLRGMLSDTSRYASLERELEEYKTQNARLEAAAITAWQHAAARPQDELAWLQPTTPLMSLRLVEARVLGRRAQSLLARGATLDAGTKDGLQPEDWVVDGGPAILDQGSGTGLAVGQLVLTGRRILGKLIEASPQTSQVRRPTDPGYRDLVQLAYRRSEQWSPGPRGLLEGTGEPLCRIRMVPTTEAVTVGDAVLLAGGEGILPHALYYGEIVRVERPAGATHWDLWMQPALDNRWPETVAVVSATIPDVVSALQTAGPTFKAGEAQRR